MCVCGARGRSLSVCFADDYLRANEFELWPRVLLHAVASDASRLLSIEPCPPRLDTAYLSTVNDRYVPALVT